MTQLPDSEHEPRSESLEKLQQVSKLVSQLLANLSHEVRTPTHLIMGYSKLLLNEEVGSLNEKQKEFVNIIHKTGEKLLAVFDEVITIYHIAQFPDWRVSEPQQVNLEHLIDQLDMPIVEKRGFENLPSVWLDEHRTSFVFSRLLLLPYPTFHDDEREIFIEASSNPKYVTLQILIKLGQNFWITDDEPILFWSQMSFEQLGGYLQWERPNPNSLLLKVGLPAFSDQSHQEVV